MGIKAEKIYFYPLFMYRRKNSLRLKRWDYSNNGWYFVTIFVQNGVLMFGEVVRGVMESNESGKLVYQAWKELPKSYPTIAIDEFVIMPNHMHGIIINKNPVGEPLVGTQPRSTQSRSTQSRSTQFMGITKSHNHYSNVSNIIGAYKSITTNGYIRNVKQNNWKPFQKRIWQRSFHDHIIQDEPDLHRIRTYIQNNPQNWECGCDDQ